MLDLISYCCFISMTMYIWFDTNAFYEIMKKLMFFQEDCFEPYEEYLKATGVDSFFAEYLSVEDTFLSKLLSCPICLSVWICLAVSIATNLFHIGLYFIVSNIIYFSFKSLILFINERGA